MPFRSQLSRSRLNPLVFSPCAERSELLCFKNKRSHLDTVSTGSGSDLVSDQQAILLTIPYSYRLTKSLPLPVLTVSRNEAGLSGKAVAGLSAELGGLFQF